MRKWLALPGLLLVPLLFLGRDRDPLVTGATHAPQTTSVATTGRDEDVPTLAPRRATATRDQARRAARDEHAMKLAKVVHAVRRAGADRVTHASSSSPTQARSAEEQALADFKTLFSRGQDAYEEGDYELAHEIFLEAYGVKPVAPVLYNAAVCSEKMADYTVATELFTRYLEEKPDARDREAVLGRIRRLEEQAAGSQPPG